MLAPDHVIHLSRMTHLVVQSRYQVMCPSVFGSRCFVCMSAALDVQVRDFGDLSYLVKGNYEKGMRALLRRAHLRPLSARPRPAPATPPPATTAASGGRGAGTAVTGFEARKALEVRLERAPLHAALVPCAGPPTVPSSAKASLRRETARALRVTRALLLLVGERSWGARRNGVPGQRLQPIR